MARRVLTEWLRTADRRTLARLFDWRDLALAAMVLLVAVPGMLGAPFGVTTPAVYFWAAAGFGVGAAEAQDQRNPVAALALVALGSLGGALLGAGDGGALSAAGLVLFVGVVLVPARLRTSGDGDPE